MRPSLPASVRHLSLLLAGLAFATALAAQAPGSVSTAATAARTRLTAGRASLDAGQFATARAQFDAAIATGSALGTSERAAAYFGRGVAAQELLRRAAGDSADAAYEAVLADYAWARGADPGRYAATATYNEALIQRALGRHDEAARSFRAAAAAGTPATRGRALLHAAQELEAAGGAGAADSAFALYTAAAAADSSLVDARLALARRPASAATASAVASSLEALLRDSSRAPDVADAALAALTAEPAVDPVTAGRLLLTLVRANNAANVSASYFATAQRARVDSAAERHPALRDAIVAMREAYGGRDVNANARSPFRRAGWWEEERDTRTRAWNAMLRTIGGWHERGGRDSLAMRYYAGAIGYPYDMMDPWADLDALLPLVLLHDRRAATSPDAARELDRLINFTFGGKGSAYAAADLSRIRQFHMTLGAYYASKEQWAGTPRGAVFQLDRMRATTAQLNGRTGSRRGALVDPPELLEQLILGYIATGRAAAAPPVISELSAANAAVGREDTSERWRARAAAAARTAPARRP